jgi:hypothetical protein
MDGETRVEDSKSGQQLDRYAVFNRDDAEHHVGSPCISVCSDGYDTEDDRGRNVGEVQSDWEEDEHDYFSETENDL